VPEVVKADVEWKTGTFEEPGVYGYYA